MPRTKSQAPQAAPRVLVSMHPTTRELVKQLAEKHGHRLIDMFDIVIEQGYEVLKNIHPLGKLPKGFKITMK